MRSLKNFIAGLQIIASVEGDTNVFNSLHENLYIGEVPNFTEAQIKELDELGFSVDNETDSFYYDLG